MNFCKDFFGFAEMPFTLKKPDGSERIAFIKINDTQYLELFAEAPKDDGMLNHIAVYTDNADAMRDYLASKNVKVPDHVGKGQTGNKNFTITDPDGHSVEIVEYMKDSRTSQEQGKFMRDTRVSMHLMHTGFLVGSLSRAVDFYHDSLRLRGNLARRRRSERAELGEPARARRRGLRRVHAVSNAAGR